MIGIYQIQSKSHPERVYIGSSINIENRWIDHKYSLRYNDHHSYKLQNHYNKYGIDDLVYSVLFCCSKEVLMCLEQLFFDTLKPYFNISMKAYGNEGIKRTPEVRLKISRACQGRVAWNKGRLRTEEEKQHQSKVMTGRKQSKETVEKRRLKSIGHKYTPTREVIEKTRQKNLGRKQSKEVIEKRMIKIRGIKRPKSSEAMKRVWEKRKLSKQCA